MERLSVRCDALAGPGCDRRDRTSPRRAPRERAERANQQQVCGAAGACRGHRGAGMSAGKNASAALLSGDDGSNYTARHLLVLEGLEAVRKRPGMYIGSTDSRGLMHCLWEIIDNSVDEALGGHCDRIEVVLHDDSSVEVRDNGRGIPVDVEPKTGLSGVEVVMTKLHMRRQVRRRLLRGLRRPARCRRLGGQRPLGPAGRRGGPQRPHPRDQLPPGHPRHLHRAQPGRAVRARQRPDQGPQGPQGPHRHPDPLLGRPPDLPPGGEALPRRPAQPGPADRLPGPRPHDRGP